MSIPNLPDILGAALHGALADTQAWLARQGQQVQANLQAEVAPVGQTFSNLGTAAQQFQQYAGHTYTPDNTPQFDPHADGGSIGDPVQRFAQAILAEQQGKVDLPFAGGNGILGSRQVDYSKLPGPLNALAHVAGAFDNAAGLTGEVLGHATTDAMGALTAATAGSSQAGYYALHPDQTPNASDQAYIDAFHALMEGHAGRANDIAAAQHPYLQGAQNLAAGFLPGAQVALPEEIAANAPRLAALVDALNAASKASIKPFELAPIMPQNIVKGIGAITRPLTATDDVSRLAGEWATSRTTPQILPALDRIAPANGDLLGNWVGRATDPLMTGGPRANIQPLGSGPNQIPTPQAQLIAQLVKGNDARPAFNAVAPPVAAPTPVRAGRAALNGTTPDVGNWIARATDNTLRDAPLGTGPAQIPTPQQQMLADLLHGHGATPDVNATTPAPPAITPGIPPLSLRGTLGDWVARASDNTLRDMPLGTGPSQFPQQPDPLTALALDQLQYLPPRPLADPTIRPGQAPLPVDTSALPGLPTTPEAGAQSQITPNVDISPASLSGVANSPLDALRQLMQSGDGGRGMVYPPSDPAFYAKRLGLDPTQVPALLAHLVQDGTLGTDHTGALAIRPQADTGIPANVVSAADEAQAAHFAYPDPTPQAQTPMPDFPGYSGQDRASILRALPPQQIDTLVNLAYPVEDAVANALNKYPDPAALVDAALARIQTSRSLSARLQQADPELAKAVAFLPDAAEQGAQAAPATVAALPEADRAAWQRQYVGQSQAGTDILAPTGQVGSGDLTQTALNAMAPADRMAMLKKMLAPDQGLVHPLFNTPPALALGNAVGGVAQVVGNAAKAYRSNFANATQHLLDVNAGDNNSFLPGKGNALENGTAGYRAEHKTWLAVPLRNYIGNMVNAAGAGGVSPLEYIQEVSTLQGNQDAFNQARQAAEKLADPVAQKAALDTAHLNYLSPWWQRLRQQYGDSKVLGILDTLGEDFQPQDSPAADVKAIQGAVRGVGATMLTPAGAAAAMTGMGLPAAALGAARGALLPWRSRMQTNTLMAIDQGGRLKVAEKAIQGALDQGASIDAAGQAGSTAAIRAFRDYKNGGDMPGWLNTIFPNSSWNVGQMHVMANILQDHPELLPAAVIAAQHGLYPQVNRAEPQKTMTLQISDQSPYGLGLLARGINGGAAGTANIDPAYPFAPVGGDLLNVLDDWQHPELHPNASIVQRLSDTIDASGVQLHPVLTALLQHAGILRGTTGDPDKLAKVGEAGDLLLNNYLDAHLPNTPANNLVRDLAGHLPTFAGLPNYDDVNAGRVQDANVDKAVNEIVYEQTGKPLMDPSNRDLLAQTVGPGAANTPLMQQAKARAAQQLVGAALANNAAPGPVAASTDTKSQEALAQASLRAAGLSDDQIKQLELSSGNPLVDIQYGMLSALQQAGMPAARIYADATPKERGELLIQFYHHDHNSYAFANPAGEQYQESVEQQRLGLRPAGSLIQPARSYALGALGLTPGGGGTIPPQLRSLLPGLLGPTSTAPSPYATPTAPALPYQLPPGAGRP